MSPGDAPAWPCLIFLYHQLCTQTSTYSYALDRRRFASHADLVAAWRRKIDEAVPSLWPEISFDDGHLSDYEHALPILADRNLSAHFFITVGWTGREPGYMGWPEIQALHNAGNRIGAHGWTHTMLTHCSTSDLQRELGDARKALEDNLGCEITSMSLPGGRYNRKVLASCQENGYVQVFTSIPRVEPSPHQFLLGRVNVKSHMDQNAIAELLLHDGGALAALKRHYELRAALQSMLGDTIYAKLWAALNRATPRDTGTVVAAP